MLPHRGFFPPCFLISPFVRATCAGNGVSISIIFSVATSPLFGINDTSVHYCTRDQALPTTFLLWDFYISLAEIVAEQGQGMISGAQKIELETAAMGQWTAIKSVYLPLHIWIIAVSFHFPEIHLGIVDFCRKGRYLRATTTTRYRMEGTRIAAPLWKLTPRQSSVQKHTLDSVQKTEEQIRKFPVCHELLWPSASDSLLV